MLTYRHMEEDDVCDAESFICLIGSLLGVADNILCLFFLTAT